MQAFSASTPKMEIPMSHTSPQDLEPLIEHWFAQGTAAVGNPTPSPPSSAPRRPRSRRTSAPPARPRRPHRLARQRLGQAAASCSASASASSKPCRQHPSPAPLLRRQRHLPCPPIHRRADGIRIVPGGSSVRAGAYLASRRRLHAPHVHQRRRLCRRRHHGRLPRPGRLLRPDRQARPSQRRRPDRRRPRAHQRQPRHH